MAGARITEERLDLDAEIVAKKKGISKEVSKMVLEAVLEERQNHRRQPKPPVPEGHISLSEAERRFGISNATFSRWARKKIPSIRFRRERYIDAKLAEKIAEAYKKAPGQGKWTINQIINNL